MLIASINAAKASPAFASRSRMDQNNTNKLYEGQIIYPSDSDVMPVGRALLFQRFNFNEHQQDGVNPEDRTYDSFTGLRDKNYLLAVLDVAIQNAQRDDKPLSIAMLDMDNFKSINELLGYETGDKFIKEISKDASEIAKENNINVYRFGGEEFVLIFDDQTDAQKEAIARAVAGKTNTNSVVQSYKNLYMRNAQSRLDKAFYSTAKVQKISELKTKKETIEEVAKSLNTQEAKDDPYFSNAIEEIDAEIDSICLGLVNKRIHKEQDESSRQMLKDTQTKLSSGKKLSESEQKTLFEYLFGVYDKANEVYQTKKWMSNFKQNGGFGITCGVVNFEPESLEYKTPMDIIGKAGKVLKRGKDAQKGQVYIESVR